MALPRTPSPFGCAVDQRDEDDVSATLEQLGLLAQADQTTLARLEPQLHLDAELTIASRRWRVGQPDPEFYVPGDTAALRFYAVSGSFNTASQLLERRGRLTPRATMVARRFVADVDVVYSAIPFFLPAPVAVGVLASHPPDDELVAGLRLPFARILVIFSADLAVDWAAYPWPELPAEFLADREVDRYSLLRAMLEFGGYVSGMLLFSTPDGHLDDHLLWLVAANPDPAKLTPGTTLRERVRGVLHGWRSRATLAPLVANIAAVTAWGAWHPPDRSLDLPKEPGGRAWRKAVNHGMFRRLEPHGAAVGVHVLDLARTTHQPTPSHDKPSQQRLPTAPHLRRGHWRRVRVGPRAAWQYEVRWIPPTFVAGAGQPPALRVYRLPAPPGPGEQPR